jgi:beta-glucosidase
MSIDWSRIEPIEGCFNKEALEHYIDELSKLKLGGIQVFVTLHHFTHPMWFEKLGHFQNIENLKY